MEKQVMVIEFDGDKVSATRYFGGKETKVEMYNFNDEDDFLYCCAYLIDEMANPKNVVNEKGFFGRAVCISAPQGAPFTIGEVYDFENGRCMSDDLKVFPCNYKIGASLGTKRDFSVDGINFFILKER